MRQTNEQSNRLASKIPRLSSENRKQFRRVSLLFVSVLALVTFTLPITGATSQISTTWLTRDADERKALSKQELRTFSAQHNDTRQLDFDSISFDAQSTKLNSSAEQWAQKRSGPLPISVRNAVPKPVQLTTAASSLQPAIASIEAPQQPAVQHAQRRTGNGPLRFRLAHIGPAPPALSGNLSYSLDDSQATGSTNLWTGSAIRLNSSGASAQNSQVQFDEDNTPVKRGDNSVTIELAPAVSDNRFGGLRRQDNETTSTLAPQHQEAPPVSMSEQPVIQFDDQHSSNELAGAERNASRAHQQDTDTALAFNDNDHNKSNSGTSDDEAQRAALDSSGAYSHNASINSRERAQLAPPVYYLPNGDIWNMQEFNHWSDEHDAQRHRNLAPPAPAADEHWDNSRRQLQQQRRRHTSERPFVASALHMTDGAMNGRFRPIVDKQHNHWNNRVLYQARHTTSLPQISPHALARETFDGAHLAGARSRPQPLSGPMLVQHPTLRHTFGQQQYQRPLRTRPQRVELSTNANHQSVLGNFAIGRPAIAPNHRVYNLRSNLQTRPRRKSIFSKLNNWATQSSSSSSTDDEPIKVSLEDAFYDAQPLSSAKQRKYRRPMAPDSISFVSMDNNLAPALYSVPRAVSSHSLPFGHVRQPTVAPATNTLYQMAYSSPVRQHQMHAAPAASASRQQAIQHSPSQQPASFIPVVAMQVTRTSPAPILPSLDVEPVSNGDQNSNEIDDYLELKTGQRALHRASGRPQAHFAPTRWDNLTGDQTLATNRQQVGSATSNSMRHHQLHLAAPAGPAPRHETTVTKSAVFGYLPHQADGPLLQAMNVLEQMPQPSMPAAGLPRAANKAARQGSLLAQHSGGHNELYASQMDQSSQAADTATPFIDQHALIAALPQQQSNLGQVDESPSSTLQLQTNNYIQNNDIAHPFSPTAMFGIDQRATGANQQNLASYASDSGQIRPLGVVYPSEQFLQQQQLLGSLLAEQLPQQHQHQQHEQQAQTQQRHLFAAGELNPLLQQHHIPALFVAAPAGMMPFVSGPVQYASGGGVSAGTGQPADSGDESSGDAQSASATTTTTPADEPLGDEAKPTASPSKGKKRSSEFFASAGQLLLSALPLLLAPTLGLMFASSPSQMSLAPQVARLHPSPVPTHLASSDYNNDAANWSSLQANSNGLNSVDGLVSNASPSPQFFTPMPLSNGGGYAPPRPPPHDTAHETLVNEFGQQQQQQVAASVNKGVTLPALTGFKMEPSFGSKTGGRNSSTSTTTTTTTTTTSTTTPRPSLRTLILTTLSPPPFSNTSSDLLSDEAKNYFANGHDLLLELGDSSNSSIRHYISNGSIEHISSAPSIVLLTAESDESTPNDGGTAPPPTPTTAASTPTIASKDNQIYSQQKSNYSSSGPFQLGPWRRNATSTVLYDVSYEGTDFDAHIPTLGNVRPPTGVPLSILASQQEHALKFAKDKNRYKYAEAQTTTAAPELRHRRRPAVGLAPGTAPKVNFASVAIADESGDRQRERLFPVTTWPVLRRRTVSLVTSQGNRTLLDSSHRYISNTEPAGQLVPARSSASASVQLVAGDAEHQRATDARHEAGSHLLDSFLLERPYRRDHKRQPQQQDETQDNEASQRTNRLLERQKRQATASDKDDLSASQDNRAKAIKKERRRRKIVVKRIKAKRIDDDESLKVSPVLNVSMDEMSGDASRRKSAIVTAMITRLEPSSSTVLEPDEHALGESDSGEQQDLDDRLRAQLLHKKMLIERLATRSNELDDLRATDRANLLGRARLKSPPAPFEPNSTARMRLVSSQLARQQDLSEDTQRALAKFGSLMLEDTLQLPADGAQLEHERPPSQYRKQVHPARLRLKSNHNDNDDNSELGVLANDTAGQSATERYSFHSMRPTQSPALWQYAQRLPANETEDAQGEAYHRRVAAADHQHPSSRLSRPHQSDSNDTSVPIELYARNNYRNEAHLSGPKGQQESPIGRYNHFLQSHFNQSGASGARHNRSSAQQAEPLDARFSTYSNYSTPYNADYAAGYYGARRDVPAGAPPPGYLAEPHHASDVHARPNYIEQHYNYSAPFSRPGYYARDDYSLPAGAYHAPATSQAVPLSPAVLAPGPGNRYAPQGYAAQQQQYGADQMYGAARGYHPSEALHSPSRPMQEASELSHDDPARSVNDYLKRVQFSDSDRDKLMASYLTCDGLLNDNDHCLERLSCEFSDPQNIEKANKLDRAVSSILLGHILINTYIPNSFKLRLKSASLFGYTQSGKCSKYACSKLSNSLRN